MERNDMETASINESKGGRRLNYALGLLTLSGMGWAIGLLNALPPNPIGLIATSISVALFIFVMWLTRLWRL